MSLPASLLNTAEVAIWLGVSQRTICLWAECSELPAIRVGRQWRFRRELIEKWLSSNGIPADKRTISADAATAAKAAYGSAQTPVETELRRDEDHKRELESCGND